MLKKLSFPLSLVTVAVLAACASRAQPVPTAVIVTPPPQPATVVAAPPASSSAPTAAVTTPALRPGAGRIESIAPAPQWSASSGSTQPSGMRRVTVRMDDGTTQILDTDAPSLRVGDRVQITPDGYIRNPAQ
jgi:hypothetical protein